MSSFSLARLNFALEPKRSAQRIGIRLLLAVLLFLAQTAVFLHEQGHDSTAPDTYCALCLAAQHLDAAVPPAQHVSSTPLQALSPPQPAVPALQTAPGVPFSARAPPASS